MASALLRTSVGRGSAFRRVASAAAVPSGREGLAVTLRRLHQSGEPTLARDEKVKSLNQIIKNVNRKMEKAHVVYASVQRS